MRDMSVKALPWLFCFFFLGCAESPQIPRVLIVIHTTTWNKDTWVRIEAKNGKYVAENMEIPEEEVMAFLAAVDVRSEERELERLCPTCRLEGPFFFSDLGISQNWLDQNAEPAFAELFQDPASSISPSQKDLFISAFRNATVAKKAVDEYFRSGWTDDFAMVHVEIYDRSSLECRLVRLVKPRDLTCGKNIVLESSELHAFMIPWMIRENGQDRFSFNANIGRTLGALMPEKAALKERIGGGYFRRGLSRSVYAQVCPEWRKLDRNPKAKFRLAVHGGEPFDYLDPCYP